MSLQFTSDDLLFRCPCRILVIGPSQSGKSYFVTRLIESRQVMFDKPPSVILFVYSNWQSLYDRLQNNEKVSFTQQLPDELPNNGLLVLDDQLLNVDKRSVSLFIQESRHKNSSVVYLSQTVFGGPLQRALSINSTYLVLMKSPRDKLSVSTLARQMYPTKSTYLTQAYLMATTEPYSHFLIDLHVKTDEQLRLRSHILPTDYPTRIYTPRK